MEVPYFPFFIHSFPKPNCVVLGFTCTSESRARPPPREKRRRLQDRKQRYHTRVLCCVFLYIIIIYFFFSFTYYINNWFAFEIMCERGNHCTTKISKGLQYSKLLTPMNQKSILKRTKKKKKGSFSLDKTLRFTQLCFVFLS